MNGILFKDEMVLPILNTKPDVWPAQPIDENGAFKWQTRRKVKFPDRWFPELRVKQWNEVFYFYHANSGGSALPEHMENPRYKAGEILYVKEVFSAPRTRMGQSIFTDCTIYRADLSDKQHPFNAGWTSSLIMPAKAARLWVKVMNVRVERVKDISEDDCIAEGINHTGDRIQDGKKTCGAISVKGCYKTLYDYINGNGSFERDWCFVYEFQRV